MKISMLLLEPVRNHILAKRWRVFPFRNNFKDLSPSFKRDLELWIVLGEKTPFYS